MWGGILSHLEAMQTASTHSGPSCTVRPTAFVRPELLSHAMPCLATNELSWHSKPAHIQRSVTFVSRLHTTCTQMAF